jgi:RNase H-fold protein (predicted Holliday junction resolvase)
LKLDEMGSETWILINSKRNVNSIAEELEEKFGDRIKPVNERLTTFLTQLYSHKFISFMEIKEKGD